MLQSCTRGPRQLFLSCARAEEEEKEKVEEKKGEEEEEKEDEEEKEEEKEITTAIQSFVAIQNSCTYGPRL